ncbi:MAG: hypothetical protein ACRC1D_07295 [Culicoidibacterales bacterium]
MSKIIKSFPYFLSRLIAALEYKYSLVFMLCQYLFLLFYFKLDFFFICGIFGVMEEIGKKTTETEKKRPVSPINGQPIPNGRPKGVGNKSTERVRKAVAALLENNADNISEWIKEIHEQDGAKDAMKIYIDLIEFVMPKLTRAAVDLSSEDGSMTPNVTIEIIKK